MANAPVARRASRRYTPGFMAKRRKRSRKAKPAATHVEHFSEAEEQFFREGATLHEREQQDHELEEPSAPPGRLRRLWSWLRVGSA